MTTEPDDDGVYAATVRSNSMRQSDRARYRAQSIHATLDEALICHVGYVDDGYPVVIPLIHTRVDENLYLYTSTGSRLTRLAEGGDTSLCVTVTLLDGLVLARSQVNHSVNYRSVTARGQGILVTDEAEKRSALSAVVEHIVAGRSRHSRPPTEAELAAIVMIRLPLTDAEHQSRTGPPVDDEEDLGLHHWAGVIGIRNDYGPAFPAPDLPYDRPVPRQLTNYSRSARPQAYR
jgi:nitroimidazol reductase NimA-like FMN-containing flavoprotein (pyridoxamine 5'-phosphate oxidase superfamily)